ncbi:MAG: S8 family serine peptidase [Gammaproteobacteria bacterium]|nr:S8 family serine peptidase [Gammaproteobacteria bacterium]
MRKVYAAVAGLALVAALAILVPSAQTPEESSSATPDLPRAEAPPTPSGGLPNQAVPAAAAETPSPPEGYAYAGHSGEMRLAPLAQGAAVTPGVRAPWLEPSAGAGYLVAQADAAGRDWTFAWLQRSSSGPANDLSERLHEMGAQVLGNVGAYVRLRVPTDADRLRAIASLPDVVGLGAPPPEAKVDAQFLAQAAARPASERVDVSITLMPDDADGRWRQELKGLGVAVGRWDASLRTLAASVPFAALEAVAERDFVLAIEPVATVRAGHASAVPVMGADALRRYNPGTGRFTGTTGARIPIGVMDSGLNVRHRDIGEGRASICGASFAQALFGGGGREDFDLWLDLGLHGTHVTGTFAGSGANDPLHAGIAPGVRHIRFAKVLSQRGLGTDEGVRQAMDFLATRSSCEQAEVVSPSARALIVNMSLGETSLQHTGRGVGERKLDSTVWTHRQLYVVAQANANVFGFSNYAAAKNSLAVGAASDTGTIAPFSSHGPTADGRLAPNVVGTGVGISSALGGGRTDGYIDISGTSMASPAVAGVAALLLDAAPEFRRQPALARARLMASAIKPDAFLAAPEAFAANNSKGPGALQDIHGLGLVSAAATVLQRDAEDGWTTGSAVSAFQDASGYAYQDIDVPVGASRLDVVLTWDEQPADTITEAVLSDLDLWLDEGADCGEGACGEHASRSRIDNVEWLLVRDPAPGRHRIKIVPERIYGQAPRGAVAWTAIRGDSTPTLSVEASSPRSRPDGSVELDLAVTSTGYVAAGTILRLGCRALAEDSDVCEGYVDAWPPGGNIVRGDLSRPIEPRPMHHALSLGEIAAGERQAVTLRLPATTDPHRLHFTASGWNAIAGHASVEFGVLDDAPPAAMPPANDTFANATPLTQESGERSVDLLAASREPAEPNSSSATRSAWFAWRAPVPGLHVFGVSGADDEGSGQVRIDIYRNGALAALEHVAGRERSLTFQAEGGTDYRLRISTEAYDVMPQTLRWGPRQRPTNDDFASSQRIAGASGSVAGDNRGATLEPHEFFGSHSTTAWYRWRAPEDGHFAFSVDEPLRVFAFTGRSIPALRRVSHYAASPFGPSNGSSSGLIAIVAGQGDDAIFPAAAGETYRLAVVARGAESSGSPYSLTWAPATEEQLATLADNDAFAAAESLDGDEGDAVATSGGRTVEPGEPSESGAGTVWWQWEAPSNGPFTWRLGGIGANAMSLAFFAGRSLDALEVVATGSEVVLDATAGDELWIAAGQRADSMFSDAGSAAIGWGPTPANDRPATAIALTPGGTTASSRYATSSADEPATLAGDASLWWKWTATEDGWQRFALADQGPSHIVAVYGRDPTGALELIATSDRSYLLSGRAEARVLASAGTEYWVQVAVRSGSERGEFRLATEPSTAPAWLLIASALRDGDMRADGSYAELRNLGDIAINDADTRLFVNTRDSLRLFDRDGATGRVVPAGEVAHPRADEETENGDATMEESEDAVGFEGDHLLHWAAAYQTLYAFGAEGVALAYQETDGDATEVEVCTVELGADSPLSGGTIPERIITDPSGSFLYLFGNSPITNEGSLAVFAIDEPCNLSLVQAMAAAGADDESVSSQSELMGLRDATLAADGSHIYALSDQALVTFSRDAETGELAIVSSIDLNELIGSNAAPFFSFLSMTSVTLDASGDYLFAIGDGLPLVLAFDVATEPATPALLASNAADAEDHFDRLFAVPSHVVRPFFLLECRAIGQHRSITAVDAACFDGMFVARWDTDSEQLLLSDYFGFLQPDRFGTELRSEGAPRGVQSADGSHIYVIQRGEIGSLITLERAENMTNASD